MAMDADFSARGEPPMSQPEPGRDVDPIDELIRIGERDMEPPRCPKVLPFQRRRRGRKARSPASISMSRRIKSL
jgi:hypothetical protein